MWVLARGVGEEAGEVIRGSRRAYQREWRLRRRAAEKAWREKNPEAAKAIQKRKYINEKKRRVADPAYDKDVRIRQRRSGATYRERHPDWMRWNVLRTSSHKRGMPFILTREEFSRWYLSQERKCAYCDLIDLSLGERNNFGGSQCRFFTVDRKDSALPYMIENIVLSCWLCNRGKNDIFTFDEWRQIAQTYIKPKWISRLGGAHVS